MEEKEGDKKNLAISSLRLFRGLGSPRPGPRTQREVEVQPQEKEEKSGRRVYQTLRLKRGRTIVEQTTSNDDSNIQYRKLQLPALRGFSLETLKGKLPHDNDECPPPNSAPSRTLELKESAELVVPSPKSGSKRIRGESSKETVIAASVSKRKLKMGELVQIRVEVVNAGNSIIPAIAVDLIKRASTFDFIKKGQPTQRKLKNRGEEVYHSQEYTPTDFPLCRGQVWQGHVDFSLPSNLPPTFTEKDSNYKVVYFLKVRPTVKRKKKVKGTEESSIKIVIQ